MYALYMPLTVKRNSNRRGPAAKTITPQLCFHLEDPHILQRNFGSKRELGIITVEIVTLSVELAVLEDDVRGRAPLQFNKILDAHRN